MRRIKETYGLMKQAFSNMGDDMAGTMGAAIAYYTAFSIAPLLIIAIGVAGFVFGDEASAAVFTTLEGMLGREGASAVQSMVEAASRRPRAGLAATIIGGVTLLIGATTVFGQLQTSLNLVWKVATKPSAGWRALVRQRLLSLGMVAVIGFLLLVSMLASAGLSATGAWTQNALPGGQLLWSAVNFVVSLAVTSLLFAALYKLLPDVKLSWRDVAMGGFVTALLFTIGKSAIGAYIGRSGVASSYGAAGSLIVILLWVYYSSQILIYGAEYTRAYATRGGRVIEPKENAVKTLAPSNAAALAEEAAEGRNPFAQPPGGAAALYGAGAGLLAAAALMLSRPRGARRAVAAGAVAGAGASLLLIGAGVKRAGRKDEEGPSVASRLIGMIPRDVKLAAAGGAVKAGGKEAAHHVGEKIKRKHGRHARA